MITGLLKLALSGLFWIETKIRLYNSRYTYTVAVSSIHNSTSDTGLARAVKTYKPPSRNIRLRVHLCLTGS